MELDWDQQVRRPYFTILGEFAAPIQFDCLNDRTSPTYVRFIHFPAFGDGRSILVVSPERDASRNQHFVDDFITDDFVKLMNGAAGTVAGMTREAEAGFRERVREWVGGMDMVSRDEFEAVKAIAVAAREESLALKARLDALEAGAPAPRAGGRGGKRAQPGTSAP